MAGPPRPQHDFQAHKEGRIDHHQQDFARQCRLWDWRAFHDTLGQSQPLRPYTYAGYDSIATRSTAACGQTLLPRELDLNSSAARANRWINRSLTFTHGYGFVLAEGIASADNGLPEL